MRIITDQYLEEFNQTIPRLGALADQLVAEAVEIILSEIRQSDPAGCVVVVAWDAASGEPFIATSHADTLCEGDGLLFSVVDAEWVRLQTGGDAVVSAEDLQRLGWGPVRLSQSIFRFLLGNWDAVPRRLIGLED